MTKPEVDRRRKFSRQFVPHPAYGWFMKRVLLGAFVFTLAIAAVAWLNHRQMLAELLASGFIAEEARPVIQAYAGSVLRLDVILVALLAAAVALQCSILLSRVVGPIYRLSQDLRSALETPGSPARIHFRQGDQAHDVKDLVNRLLEEHVNPQKE